MREISSLTIGKEHIARLPRIVKNRGTSGKCNCKTKAEPVKQWLAQVGAQRLDEAAAGLDEDQRRQLLRGEVADKNRSLANTVSVAGISAHRDFAVFQDWGYKGLYVSETSRDIAARKGLAKGEHILDSMGSEELAANWFRITQAEAQDAT
jgi:DNA-damage-inducible protein D